MITVKNIRHPQGTYFQMKISDGMIEHYEDQKTLEPTKPSDKSLEKCLEQDLLFSKDSHTIDARGELLVPGGIDPHVHSRDPGFTHKEDWQSLCRSAHSGGVVGLVDMPNTMPPTLDMEALRLKESIAQKTDLTYRFLMGVTAESLGALKEVFASPPDSVCGVKVYYGRSTGNLTFSRLEELNPLGGKDHENLLFVFHSEDQCMIDKNAAKKKLGSRIIKDPKDYVIHSDVRSPESALSSTTTILEWAQKYNKKVHMAHISTGAELELIAAARLKGMNVTCEVCPHHLFLSREDYPRWGSLVQVNPPLRSKEETLKLQKMAAMGSGNQARIFGFPQMGRLAAGYQANLVWLQENNRPITREKLTAKCGWSPYEGMNLSVKVAATWLKGRCVFSSVS